ncbi:MAG: HAMP domain-containing histidine kinase [Bacteroides sp.]|nr:HAMP domain-containing histidine kinase [Bacteroides sp.]
MKNKKEKKGFAEFERKLALRFFIYSAVGSAAALSSSFFIYYLLRGYFGNFFADTVSNIFGIDYWSAVEIYHRIREWDFLYYVILVFIVITVSFKRCIRRYDAYFTDVVSRSFNLLLRDNYSEADFPEEMEAIKDSFNSVKRTLERRTLDAKLSEQRKNDLIVYLAHDLKTPLTSVIGYLTLLRDEPGISEELREKYLGISLDKAQRLEDLINEFFEITRFNLTDIELSYSSVNLTRLLEQSAFEFQPMLAEKNLSYKLNAAENITVKCDADKLQRVFDNLLRNAVFYSYENTAIDINACRNGDSVTVSITNRGGTIPPEKLERLFEQFFRLDSSRGTNKGGAGLGLAIAKKIVELHGGSIKASSEDETIEFTVTVPDSIKSVR